MLCLLLNLGESVFALPCSGVVRIVPRVQLRTIPHAPDFIAGLLHYRGASIPVVDLCSLVAGKPASGLLSSRIILARFQTSGDASDNRLIGLLAERVMETITLNEADLRPSGVQIPDARYLGRVASTPHGLIQLIDSALLLTPEVRDLLFSELVPTP